MFALVISFDCCCRKKRFQTSFRRFFHSDQFIAGMCAWTAVRYSKGGNFCLSSRVTLLWPCTDESIPKSRQAVTRWESWYARRQMLKFANYTQSTGDKEVTIKTTGGDEFAWEINYLVNKTLSSRIPQLRWRQCLIRNPTELLRYHGKGRSKYVYLVGVHIV